MAQSSPLNPHPIKMVFATVFIASLVAVALPTPSSAGACQDCNWALLCVGGATCYYEEFCDDNKDRFADCYVDRFGNCKAESLCYYADRTLGLEFPWWLEDATTQPSATLSSMNEQPATDHVALPPHSSGAAGRSLPDETTL